MASAPPARSHTALRTRVAWAVNEADEVSFRFGATPWVKVEGALVQVAVSADGRSVWGVTRKHAVFYRGGSCPSCIGGSWEAIEGVALKQVAVSGNGTHVWGCGAAEEVFYRPGRNAAWQRVEGSLTNVAVSADGAHVWGCNAKAEVFYRAGRAGSWEAIEGAALTQLAVSGDGAHVWGILDGVPRWVAAVRDSEPGGHRCAQRSTCVSKLMLRIAVLGQGQASA